MPAAAYTVQGLGAATCAEFGKQYRVEPSGVETAYFGWAQGYMSGLNMMAQSQNLPARELSLDLPAQQQTIRQFCADNPLRNYMDAATHLYGKQPISPFTPK